MKATRIILALALAAMVATQAQNLNQELCELFDGEENTIFRSIFHYYAPGEGNLTSGLYMFLGRSKPTFEPFGVFRGQLSNLGHSKHAWINLDTSELPHVFSSRKYRMNLFFAFQGIAGRHQAGETNVCYYRYDWAQFTCFFAFYIKNRIFYQMQIYKFWFPPTFRPSLAFQYQPDLSSERREHSHKVMFLHQRPIYYPAGHSLQGHLVGYERKLQHIDFFETTLQAEKKLKKCGECPLNRNS